MSTSNTSRRDFFKKSALFTAGIAAASTVTAPGLAEAAAWGGDKDWKHDAALLNVALNLEHQAIAAYQVGAESKLLTPAILKVALAFQKDHEAHAAVLVETIKKIGGKPVAPRAPLTAPMADLAKAWNFPVGKLKDQADVLHFAAGLEIGAAKAYLGTVPEFGDRALAKAAANIEGDETMHYAILRNALGEFPVPAAFVSAMPD
ncbi:ferritin-like domain-containing protein [Acidithiobacillus sp. AMEEHan]|uniref:ferritin-like domain-containing protein n=1 Tax=Acidithiobacillus sp. AMEEHan TaxID=2994951 RepID=UPI0027E3F08D|nr:ferritin-like domain-containing protein [Acidithiobacillus sp. AMEEHan]